MDHFLENHFWLTAAAGFGLLVLSGFNGYLFWRLRKIRKNYKGVLLTDLSEKDKELALLFQAASKRKKAAAQKLKDEFLKRNQNLQDSMDKLTRKKGGIAKKLKKRG